MQYIEATSLERPIHSKILFLAGGISNCPDWQSEVVNELDGLDLPITIFNPRRKHYDLSNATEAANQITWEYLRLRESNHILFWFPCETLCPITLFEYGAALERGGNIFVGSHPNYQRILDLRVQTLLRRNNITIKNSLKDLIEEVKWKLR